MVVFKYRAEVRKKKKGLLIFQIFLYLLYKSYVTEYQNDWLINRQTTYNLNSSVI